MNVPQLSARKRLRSRDNWFRFLIPIGQERIKLPYEQSLTTRQTSYANDFVDVKSHACKRETSARSAGLSTRFYSQSQLMQTTQQWTNQNLNQIHVTGAKRGKTRVIKTRFNSDRSRKDGVPALRDDTCVHWNDLVVRRKAIDKRMILNSLLLYIQVSYQLCRSLTPEYCTVTWPQLTFLRETYFFLIFQTFLEPNTRAGYLL